VSAVSTVVSSRRMEEGWAAGRTGERSRDLCISRALLVKWIPGHCLCSSSRRCSFCSNLDGLRARLPRSPHPRPVRLRFRLSRSSQTDPGRFAPPLQTFITIFVLLSIVPFISFAYVPHPAPSSAPTESYVVLTSPPLAGSSLDSAFIAFWAVSALFIATGIIFSFVLGAVIFGCEYEIALHASSLASC
jgi:hypothetical protein